MVVFTTWPQQTAQSSSGLRQLTCPSPPAPHQDQETTAPWKCGDLLVFVRSFSYQNLLKKKKKTERIHNFPQKITMFYQIVWINGGFHMVNHLFIFFNQIGNTQKIPIHWKMVDWKQGAFHNFIIGICLHFNTQFFDVEIFEVFHGLGLGRFCLLGTLILTCTCTQGTSIL